MISNFFLGLKEKYKKISLKKKLFVLGGVVLALLIILAGNGTTLSLVTVSAKDLSETVVATGEVTSDVDLSLGFEKSGMVDSIKVSLGQKVKKGDVLMKLSLDKEEANLTKARGALLKAQAEYNKALSVNSGDGLSQLELSNAKIEQDQIVANAYSKLLSSDLEAVPESGEDFGEHPTIGGSYNCQVEGEYNIELYSSSSDSGYSFTVSGLETGSGTVLTESYESFGSCGLKIIFPENFDRRGSWVIEIPNTSGDSYATNLGEYQLALANRETTISELEKELEVESTSETTGDIAIAYANLVSAEGEYQSVLATVNEGVIYAPADGVVTKIDVKIGDLVLAYEDVITVQDVDNLYVKAKINEANISSVSRGQEVYVTFDAFGPDNKIIGYIESVDTAPSKEEGVVNYEIAVSMQGGEEIKPGMTATVYVVVAKKDGVIAIPSNTLLFEEGIPKVIISENGKKTKVVELGMRGDDSFIEITNGLSLGEIIYLPK